MNILTVCLLCGIFLIAALYIIIRKQSIKKMNNAIKIGDSKTLIKILNQKSTSLFVSEYIRDFYQAKAYMMDKNLNEVKQHLRVMFKKTYNTHDVEQYLTIYFHLFMQEEDYEFGLEILDRIEKTGISSFVKYCVWTKEVLLHHRSDLVKEIEESIHKKEYYGFPLAVITYLVAMQKLYVNEKEEALEWVETALTVFMPKDIYTEKAKKLKETLYKELRQSKETV